MNVTPAASVLWSAKYQQRPTSGTDILPTGNNDRVLRFSPPSSDLAFDDDMFARVKDVWEKVMDGDAAEFLSFQDREIYDDDE